MNTLPSLLYVQQVKTTDDKHIFFSILCWKEELLKQRRILVVGLGVGDRGPGHRVHLFLLVTQPLACDVVLAVVPRQVVVEQGHRGVRVVLDPLQGRP
jgi:hypothetical protein